MENTLVTTSKTGAYTMLFITDYTDASPKERKFVDTIRNNMLGMPGDSSGNWLKCPNLPEILVSVFDIAETRSKAYDMLDRNRYDVIFTSNRIDGRPIGAGYLRNVQEHHPNALIIPFIQATQLMGARKIDGTINMGAGIQAIYNLGIYTCMTRNRLDLVELVRIIHAGGRSKEDAFCYYGLDKNLAFIEGAEHPVIPMSDSQPQPSRQTDAQTHEKVAETSSEGHKEYNDSKGNPNRVSGTLQSVQDADNTAAQRPEKNGVSVRPDPQAMQHAAPGNNIYTSGQKNSGDYGNNFAQGNPEQGQKLVSTDGERKLSYKERRKLEKKQRQQEKREREMQQQEGGNREDSLMEQQQIYQEDLQAVHQKNKNTAESDNARFPKQNEAIHTEESTPSAERAENEDGLKDKFAIFEPAAQRTSEQRSEYEEMQTALQQRGKMNAGLAVPGMLQGRVVFAKGNTAWVELDKNIEDIGIGFADIYQMPVMIPYTKFGDLQ